MSKPVFVVPLADIERSTRTVTFTLDEAWLRQALEGTDATPRAAGSAIVELSKSGRDVMIRGQLRAPVTMPCVVSLDPLDIEVSSDMFLMLAPSAADAGVKHDKRPRATLSGKAVLPGKGGPAEDRGPSQKRGDHPHKSARFSKDEAEEGELLGDDAAARDTFEGSQIELDSFFREFLVLELPMFPRRSDLPSPEGPAIAPPSVEAGEPEAVVDPRLQPLAALRSRMRESKE